MDIWKINYEPYIPDEMAADLKSGKLSKDDIKIIKRWAL